MRELLEEALPYLKTLLNIHICRVEPCMSLEDENRLRKLIDEILEIIKEYDRQRQKGSDF